MTPPAAASVTDLFDPHAPDFLANPYPAYARFREHSPVRAAKAYDALWVFREADVRAALLDKERYTKNAPDRPAIPRTPTVFDVDDYLPAGPFSSDEPWHQTLRAVLEPFFGKVIANVAPLARGLAQTLLAPLSPRGGRVELVAAYALPLPAQVLLSVIGLPPSHWDFVIRWVTMVAGAHDVTQSPQVRFLGATANMALAAYYQGLLRRPPSSPPQGLVDGLIQGPLPEGIDLDALQASLVSITVAGYLSTTFLICTGLQHLLGQPEAVERLLRDDPAQDRLIVRELLRLDAPAQIVDRVVAQPVRLGGVDLAVGSRLSLVLGSANRDPLAFENPDQFQLDRTNAAQHLGFGGGIHHCIGHALASQVAPVALRELFRRLPDRLRIDGLAQWQTDPYLRGLSNLPVAWGD